MASSTTADHLTTPASGVRRPIDQIVALAYDELRAIAHRRLMARGATLSTTALVHEAYVKLAGRSPLAGWHDRAHFLAVASMVMRHLLVDRARELSALKRGGVLRRVTLEDQAVSRDDDPELLLQLNDALDRLAGFEPRLAQVVECRFFGGLTEEETAETLGLTIRTVQRDWVKARVLLRRALES